MFSDGFWHYYGGWWPSPAPGDMAQLTRCPANLDPRSNEAMWRQKWRFYENEKIFFLILLSADDVWCNTASTCGLNSLSHVINIIPGVIVFLVHVKTILTKLKIPFKHGISKKITTRPKSLQIKSFYRIFCPNRQSGLFLFEKCVK